MCMVIVHVSILALTALVILFADHEAFQYMTGKKQTLDPKKTKLLHNLVWVGLLGMIGTGLWMTWPNTLFLFTVPGFQIKAAFIAALFVNAFFIGSLMKLAFEKPFASLSQAEKTKLMLSGFVSTAGWLGATTAAILTFGNIISWVGALF